MVRCLQVHFRVVLAGLMATLAADTARAGEPAQPLRLVLAHGAQAQHWLNCLGQGLVQVEPLVPSACADETATLANRDWLAAESQIRRLTFPVALVVGPESDDSLARFWSERLRNQGGIEIIALDRAHAIASLEEDRRHIQLAHQLLVKLCPQARATLEQRTLRELQRRLPPPGAGESLVHQ